MRRVIALRMGLTAVLVVLAVGTVAGLLVLDHLAERATAGAERAEVLLAVERRDGSERFVGTVLAATPLEALLRAAEAADFEVTVVEYPNGAYVAAIGGEAAEGAGGWLYEVTRDGATEVPPRAADRTPLADGDRVRWRWTDEPTPPPQDAATGP